MVWLFSIHSYFTQQQTSSPYYLNFDSYFVAVLGFRLDISNREKYYYNAKIIDELDQEVLYPKLSYKLLVLPNLKNQRLIYRQLWINGCIL